MLRLLGFGLLTVLSAVHHASALELVTLDGQVRETDSVQFAGEACIVTRAETVERLRAREVDYYETFRRNAKSGAGNVIVFKTGAFFRFESLEMSRGRVVLGLGDQGKVTVPEQLVDFEQSVKEAGTIRLPRAAPRVDVVKTSGAPAGSARGASSMPASIRGGNPARERQARAAGVLDAGRLAGADSSAGRRSASLNGPGRSGSEPEDDAGGDDYESVEDLGDAGDSSPTPATDEGESSQPRADRDGMTDPDEVRRRAEESGEASGVATVIVSSNDAVEVAGVQFRLRYPANCTPAGAVAIGAFANASMAQPNGSVGGRPLLAMAIVYAADSTTSLPGDMARVDFSWTGAEPSAGEFLIVSASASDETGGAVRGFRAIATLLP